MVLQNRLCLELGLGYQVLENFQVFLVFALIALSQRARSEALGTIMCAEDYKNLIF